MNQQTFPISSIIQGMACSAPGCPGHLDLWAAPSENAHFLICAKCEAYWSVAEEDLINQRFFEKTIDKALKRDLTRKDLCEILDHHQFYVNEDKFSALVLEAWANRMKMVGEDSRQHAVIVPMERVVGKKGERWIEVQYNSCTDQIVGLEPIYY